MKSLRASFFFVALAIASAAAFASVGKPASCPVTPDCPCHHHGG